jgi:hypothetical protein
MTEASERMKRVAEIQKEDRTLELASALSMTLKEWLTAFTLKEKIAEHPQWTNRRSPHALMVDCIHIVGIYTKNRSATQKGIMRKTKELWGICTEPRVFTWKKEFKTEIKEVLDVLNKNDESNVET